MRQTAPPAWHFSRLSWPERFGWSFALIVIGATCAAAQAPAGGGRVALTPASGPGPTDKQVAPDYCEKPDLLRGPGQDIVALNPTTGEAVWHSILGAGIVISPITYLLDGSQYVAAGAGDTVFAFVILAR